MYKANWASEVCSERQMAPFTDLNLAHERRFKGFMMASKYPWDSTNNRKLSSYEGLLLFPQSTTLFWSGGCVYIMFVLRRGRGSKIAPLART